MTDLTKLALTRAKKRLMRGQLNADSRKRLSEILERDNSIERWTSGVRKGNEEIERAYSTRYVTGPDVHTVPIHGKVRNPGTYTLYLSPKRLKDRILMPLVTGDTWDRYRKRDKPLSTIVVDEDGLRDIVQKVRADVPGRSWPAFVQAVRRHENEEVRSLAQLLRRKGLGRIEEFVASHASPRVLIDEARLLAGAPQDVVETMKRMRQYTGEADIWRKAFGRPYPYIPPWRPSKLKERLLEEFRKDGRLAIPKSSFKFLRLLGKELRKLTIGELPYLALKGLGRKMGIESVF